jgi:chromodomain-helicase-DNA-binding protein 7
VILADEMGLGKTAQAIAMLDHIWRRESIRGPFLIVAPLWTLAHWQREIEEWTDLSVLNYYGRAESRDVMHQYEWHCEGPP